jgi:crotonobetainyl-CoA:carnitine CoA-transferase CaiB-like acyl-CoA transferase
VTQALSDIQAQHRGMVRALAGIPQVGSPVRLDGDRADSDLPPPALGEHTGEILASIGIEPGELDRLREAGVAG